MVIWLVGMYASGKSTIAEEIRTILEKKDNKVLVLNGGDIRQILGCLLYTSDAADDTLV